MRSGVCPKCGGTNIKRFEHRLVDGDSAAWDYEYIGVFKRAYTTRYACLDCGYCERYFEDKYLEKLKERDRKERGEL